MSVRLLMIGMLLVCFTGNAVAAEEAQHAGFISIVPPLAAILIALLFRQVIPALFVGLLIGAWAIQGLDLNGLWAGLLDTIQVYIVKALADEDHVAIVVFSMMIGGMVGVISRSGGMQGVVNLLVSWANSAKRASLSTGFLGLAIFFDDYANTLVVGNTMRPMADRMGVSRAKLAYIVDSTAAPVACIALATTWIGYEVGLIGDSLESVGSDLDAYAVFLSSISYSFYPILAIAFVFMTCGMRREFGPMYRAEMRAVENPGREIDEPVPDGNITEEPIKPKEGQPHRAANAVVPILVLIGTVFGGIWATGYEPGRDFNQIIAESNSYHALLWASLLSAISAIIMSVTQGVLTMEESIDAWFKGMRSMLMAMIILVLAWALSSVTDAETGLGTANYLVSLLGDSLNPGLIPALVFILAAATAFSTGSSWGTMAILMPLVIPLTWAILTSGSGAPDQSQLAVLYSAVSCVLAGAVWGDHCSPISDTTILSSMASGCDHIAHVQTQLPYALLVGLVSLGVGTIPAGFGMPWWLGLGLGLIILFTVLRITGQQVPEPSTQHA